MNDEDKEEMKILDTCCGGKMFWYEKDLPMVTFQDVRAGVKEYSGGRKIRIEPNHVGNVTNMDFEDETFDVVIFDPPHMVRAGKTSWLNIKYGKLPEDWRTFFTKAFCECFRVLKNNGVLVFKWNSEQIPFAEVIKLSPYKPLFGDKRSKTRWTVFVKNSVLKKGKDDE